MLSVDNIVINFSPSNIIIMNVVVGIIMFGVALDMRIKDFKSIAKFPYAAIIGLVTQFLLLPACTYILVIVLNPPPSMAMGMFLVAACPGGNFSNFLTHFAKGNTALSVCMSAISTVCAIVMTPLNFAFWGNLHPEVSKILKSISISPLDMVFTILLILGIPLVLGLLISHYYPRIASACKKPMKILSIFFFISFVIFALAANWSNFISYIGVVFFTVFLHNAIALSLGYFSSHAFKIAEKEKRAITLEVGIQNSGLGLTLVFTFFQGLGGMALIACWWGIWHIIAGLSISYFWARKTQKIST